MADQLQLRRGTTAETNTFTGAQGEVTIDTDKDTIVVHDGITAGGFPLANEAAIVDSTIYFNDDISGGSAADAYLLTPKPNSRVPTDYKDGLQLGFVTTNANTGPATVNFAGFGVRNIKLIDGSDPDAGDIDGRVNLVFDEGNDWFELQKDDVEIPDQGLRNIEVITVTGLYTKPADLKRIKVTVIGGGGGGAGAAALEDAAGGAGGGASIMLIEASALAASEPVTIGAGGAGGAAGAAGSNGGTTSFGTFCSATGGDGPIHGTAADPGSLGGLGSGGDVNVRGGSGGGSGINEAISIGGGGDSILGGGAPTAISSAGASGGAYGAGGAGGNNNNAGGDGADGVIIVEEYY